jgi:hypothetical protein
MHGATTALGEGSGAAVSPKPSRLPPRPRGPRCPASPAVMLRLLDVERAGERCSAGHVVRWPVGWSSRASCACSPCSRKPRTRISAAGTSRDSAILSPNDVPGPFPCSERDPWDAARAIVGWPASIKIAPESGLPEGRRACRGVVRHVPSVSDRELRVVFASTAEIVVVPGADGTATFTWASADRSRAQATMLRRA